MTDFSFSWKLKLIMVTLGKTVKCFLFRIVNFNSQLCRQINSFPNAAAKLTMRCVGLENRKTLYILTSSLFYHISNNSNELIWTEPFFI